MSAIAEEAESEGVDVEMMPIQDESEPTQKESHTPLEIYEKYVHAQQLQFSSLIECLNSKDEFALDFHERFRGLILALEESSEFFLNALSSKEINVSDIEEALKASELKKRSDSVIDFSILFPEEPEKNEWLSKAKNFLNLLFLNPEICDLEVLNRIQPLIKILGYFNESNPNIEPLIAKFEIIKTIKNEKRLFSNLRDILDPKSNETPSMSFKELIKELEESNRIFLEALKSGKINISDILKALTKEKREKHNSFLSGIFNSAESSEDKKSNEFAIYREWVASAVRFFALLLSKPEIFYLEAKISVDGIQLYKDEISNSIQPLVEVLYYFNKLDPSVKPLIIKFELIKKIKKKRGEDGKKDYDLFLSKYERSFGGPIQHQIFSDLDDPMSRSVGSIMDTLFGSYVGLSDNNPLSLLEQTRDAAWLLLKLKQLDIRGRKEGFEQYIHKLRHTYFSRVNNYKEDLLRCHPKQYVSLYEPTESEVTQKIKEINTKIEKNLGKKEKEEEQKEIADAKPREIVGSSLGAASEIIGGTQFFNVELNETQNEDRETKRDGTKSFENMTESLDEKEDEKREKIEGKEEGEKIENMKSGGIDRRLGSPSEVDKGIQWSYIELNGTPNKDSEPKSEGSASFILGTLFGWLDKAKEQAKEHPVATTIITVSSFLLIGAGICAATGGAGLPVLVLASAICLKISLAAAITVGGMAVTQGAWSFFKKCHSDGAAKEARSAQNMIRF